MIGMRPMRILASLVVLFLVLAVAACGGDGTSPPGSAAGAAPTPEPAATVEPTQTTTPPPDPVQPAAADPAATPESAGVEPAPTTAPAPEPAATVERTQSTTPPPEPEPPDVPSATGVGPAYLQGRWEGVTLVPGLGDLPFTVTFRASDDGLRATIDIQGAVALRLSNVALDAGRVHFG